MINKIERLVSIGKYRNYQATGVVNFRKLTLIYGDNGGGKTTLTSVLRSLTSNNPEIIRSRISTNHTNPQAAQITYKNGTLTHYTFHPVNGWASHLPTIEIFDVHFVNDNVYSGFEVTDGHKKQLHKFVVGAQGVTIQNQIEANKAAKIAIRARRTEFDRRLNELVGNGFTPQMITAFIAPAPARSPDLEAQITNAATALVNANANAVIQTLQSLAPLERLVTRIDFAAIVADLQATTQTIQDRLLQEFFTTHTQALADNAIENPDGWLRTGFRYIQQRQQAQAHVNHNGDVDCPFCKQEIRMDSDVLRAYALRFNEEFNLFIQRLQAHLAQVRAFNLDVAILALSNVGDANTQRIGTWSPHLRNTATTAPVYNVLIDEAQFRREYQELIDSIERKIQTPSVSVATTSVTNLQLSGAEINRRIAIYNHQVSEYNAAITTFRRGIRTVAEAQNELNRLRRLQNRYLPEVDQICHEYSHDNARHRTLEREYTELARRQEADTNTFFTQYKDRINHYLTTVFRTSFRIEDVQHIAPSGRATENKLGYKLTIDSQDISFEPNRPYSTRECLSEGDKSTIALAFFLSKLDLDVSRADKILVFDDPLSSLDTNRRGYTVSIIRQLMTQMKQVVVLSHNEYFLHELSRSIRAQDLSTLRITEDFVARASRIESCDLEELAKNDYFKQIDYLENFRINPNHLMKDVVLGWLRTVLESHLRFKFYRDIRAMGNADKTFGALIRFLDGSTVVFRDNANRQQIIATLNMINNISWMPHHGIPAPDYATLIYNPSTITAPQLDTLIVETLDLINNRL